MGKYKKKKHQKIKCSIFLCHQVPSSDLQFTSLTYAMIWYWLDPISLINITMLLCPSWLSSQFLILQMRKQVRHWKLNWWKATRFCLKWSYIWVKAFSSRIILCLFVWMLIFTYTCAFMYTHTVMGLEYENSLKLKQNKMKHFLWPSWWKTLPE